MLRICVLMMCNCTAAFAKTRQYEAVGIGVLGNIFQKCPESLSSADIHKRLPQGIFASLEKHSETSKLLSRQHSFIAAEGHGFLAEAGAAGLSHLIELPWLRRSPSAEANTFPVVLLAAVPGIW